MLILSRKIGETIMIGDSIGVTVSRISASRVTLAFTAPPDVKVLREEIFQEDPRATMPGIAAGETCNRFGCRGAIATDSRRGLHCPACGWDPYRRDQ